MLPVLRLAVLGLGGWLTANRANIVAQISLTEDNRAAVNLARVVSDSA
jgi:hypothetical protein